MPRGYNNGWGASSIRSIPIIVLEFAKSRTILMMPQGSCSRPSVCRIGNRALQSWWRSFQSPTVSDRGALSSNLCFQPGTSSVQRTFIGVCWGKKRENVRMTHTDDGCIRVCACVLACEGNGGQGEALQPPHLERRNAYTAIFPLRSSF